MAPADTRAAESGKAVRKNKAPRARLLRNRRAKPMPKLTDTEKKKRAADRFKAREQKFTSTRWAKHLEPQLYLIIHETHVLLKVRAWRENPPPHVQKARPLIDTLYRP